MGTRKERLEAAGSISEKILGWKCSVEGQRVYTHESEGQKTNSGCYGYGFGDEHINRVIKDMLTIPSAHLVIISYDDPLGRVMRTYEKMGRPAQVTLLVGDHLGDLRSLVDRYLPKSAIDRTTFRMAELLKARWSTRGESSPDREATSNEGDSTS